MLTELYRQGRFDLDVFVTEEIALDQVEEAFTRMHHGDVLPARARAGRGVHPHIP